MVGNIHVQMPQRGLKIACGDDILIRRSRPIDQMVMSQDNMDGAAAQNHFRNFTRIQARAGQRSFPDLFAADLNG